MKIIPLLLICVALIQQAAWAQGQNAVSQRRALLDAARATCAPIAAHSTRLMVQAIPVAADPKFAMAVCTCTAYKLDKGRLIDRAIEQGAGLSVQKQKEHMDLLIHSTTYECISITLREP